MVKTSKILLIALLGLLILSFILNLFFLHQNLERNRVVMVVDGDSLELRDGRRIRLLGIDAPEKGRCGADRAKVRLTDLIDGKIVRLSDVVTDDYGRQLANVWVADWTNWSNWTNGKKLVNKMLVEEGLAKFVYVKSPYYEEIKQAGLAAKTGQRGIYSAKCRTDSPNPDCLIKGNIRDGKGKVYHLPSCPNYDQVIIDESYGDRWFCSETEATKNGFRKAEGCR